MCNLDRYGSSTSLTVTIEKKDDSSVYLSHETAVSNDTMRNFEHLLLHNLYYSLGSTLKAFQKLIARAGTIAWINSLID